MTNHRVLAGALRFPAWAQIPVCLAWMAAGCGGSEGVPIPGSGGASSSGGSGGVSHTGGSASGGTSSSGGSSSGGATHTGGSSSGGTSSSGGSSSGGASSSGGSASGGAPSSGGPAGRGVSGTGGSAGRGVSSSGGSVGSGGAAGGTATGGSTGAAQSAGCGKTSMVTFTTVPGESGTNVGTGTGGYVTINGRGFAMRLPDNYDKTKPYWLIFGFHWNGGTAKDVDTGGSNGYLMAHFGLQKLSKNGAIFVAPQGNGNGWGNSGGADLKFVDDMVKLIEDNYCVDTTHVLTNGFSYGGGMSYEIACARAKVFRAAAIYEGAKLSGCDGGSDPIALWQMVGLEDTTCPMTSATPIRDQFVTNNGCTKQSPPQPPKGPPYLNPGGHVCTDYAGCSAGHPLRWCVHQSGHGNAIVDGSNDLYNSCGTPPKTCSASCPCSWVPDDVWKFFTAL
jgi:poly(3-hydroxybutyrate) depolymerase